MSKALSALLKKRVDYGDLFIQSLLACVGNFRYFATDRKFDVSTCQKIDCDVVC